MHLREMDANLLVVLDALLVEASVTRASERLGRSPSAVSHALANLRFVFNDDLFVRAGQKLVPTAKAIDIAPTVHVIISGMESLLRPTNPFDPSLEKRTFSISGYETFEVSLYEKIRTKVNQQAPGIKLNWEATGTDRILDALREGKIQAVLTAGKPEEDNSEFLWHHLYDDQLVTLARASHPVFNAKAKTKQADQEQGEHIVACSGIDEKSIKQQLEAAFSDTQCRVQKTQSVFGALFSASLRDVLITVPASAAAISGECLGLVQLDHGFKSQPLPVYLGWHRSQDRDECHGWLRQLLISMTKEQPDIKAEGAGK